MGSNDEWKIMVGLVITVAGYLQKYNVLITQVTLLHHSIENHKISDR